MNQEHLLKKWLNNELSKDERESFEQSANFKDYQKIIDTAQHFKSNKDTLPSFETFKEINKPKAKPKSLKRIVIWQVAAVLVIALGLYFTFLYDTSSVVKTNVAEKTQVTLPDQSLVSLNASSKITFNKKNWNAEREVLLKGEAFFKVEKGQKFDVITTQGKVTVVGTQFNVKQRANYFEVVCYEGVVNVVADTITRTLTKGNVYRLIDRKFTQGVILENKPQWLENISTFKNVPIKEVLSELERQYGIEVSLRNTNVNRLFTGGFTHHNLEDALKAITTPMNMTYKISSEKLVVIHANKN
ncbi:FecR family protein [Mangrovimonas spongiae]|uniref:FecR family protein n=1 Tax=Mangrovimonas spongiae TaxID=2494697 RepID=A0A428K003_9FLAO|nr:FecR family protein [Mangrovimonas spongiae]RSK39707.1 FecR family protein [Mangrovimonas spongiae]